MSLPNEVSSVLFISSSIGALGGNGSINIIFSGSKIVGVRCFPLCTTRYGFLSILVICIYNSRSTTWSICLDDSVYPLPTISFSKFVSVTPFLRSCLTSVFSWCGVKQNIFFFNLPVGR